MKFNFEDKHKVNDAVAQAEETWHYQEEGEGASVEGLLVSVRKNIGENKNTVYTIEKSNGALVDVWGCAVLNTHLENLEAGKWGVKLVYNGRQEPQSGGRAYHNFGVWLLPISAAVDEATEAKGK